MKNGLWLASHVKSQNYNSNSKFNNSNFVEFEIQNIHTDEPSHTLKHID